ncbi:hypothetical protein RJ640_018861 [Escallonia rubra]|uniref:HMA domain-containing protein n=1 Tax=Escallonia rubra TaxID=112253 RepID=A0AA88UUL7_9ASTE|nr:hypothetical protein RJ640_018861 [Escallonia rubra]
MKNNLVTVTGTIDAEKLVEFVDKRAGRRAEIVKQQKKDGKNKKEDKNEGEGDRNGRKESTCHNYPPGLVYAPQLFSDENPNACSVIKSQFEYLDYRHHYHSSHRTARTAICDVAIILATKFSYSSIIATKKFDGLFNY